MAKKNSAPAPTYYGGLTYKQFRMVGKVGLWMNDLAWAGRLYSKYPYWFKRLTQLVYAALIISLLSLVVIWMAILLRPPVLLLGVYPDARVVCMPRILDEFGNIVARHSSYGPTCAALFNKAGLQWVAEEVKKQGGRLPSSDPRAEDIDPDPNFRAPTTTVDYVQQIMLEQRAQEQREAVQGPNQR